MRAQIGRRWPRARRDRALHHRAASWAARAGSASTAPALRGPASMAAAGCSTDGKRPNLGRKEEFFETRYVEADWSAAIDNPPQTGLASRDPGRIVCAPRWLRVPQASDTRARLPIQRYFGAACTRIDRNTILIFWNVIALPLLAKFENLPHSCVRPFDQFLKQSKPIVDAASR